MLNIFFCFIFCYLNLGVLQFDVEFCINISLVLFFFIFYVLSDEYITNILFTKVNNIYIILYGIIKYNYMFILMSKNFLGGLKKSGKKIKLVDRLFIVNKIYNMLIAKLFIYYKNFVIIICSSEMLSSLVKYINLTSSVYSEVVIYLEKALVYEINLRILRVNC